MIAPINPELEDLLPFYANGTLAPGERARVEAALKVDGELARRLALIEEERFAAITLNEASGAPSPRALDALMVRIEAEPRRAGQMAGVVKRSLVERFGMLLAALTPRQLAYASAAALAIIALQGAVMTSHFGERGTAGGYHTASSQEEGSFVLVDFAPQAPAGEIARVLQAAGAGIVEGPRASGLYRLRLGTEKLAPAEAARRLAILRQARGVVASAEAEQ